LVTLPLVSVGVEQGYAPDGLHDPVNVRFIDEDAGIVVIPPFLADDYLVGSIEINGYCRTMMDDNIVA
jgi:hypothetical protein